MTQLHKASLNVIDLNHRLVFTSGLRMARQPCQPKKNTKHIWLSCYVHLIGCSETFYSLEEYGFKIM